MTRTLCVDDTEASRYIFSRILREAGHEVIEGTTASDALRLARELKPDIVVLDVNLPDGSGPEVCAEIRRDPEISNTPVLLISATSIAMSDRLAGLSHGADGYLIEPAEAEEILATVNSLLRMSRAENEVRTLNEQLSARIRELEVLIDTVPIGIAISQDPDCHDVRVNQPLARMLGIGTDLDLDETARLRRDRRTTYRVLSGGNPVAAADLPLSRAAQAGETIQGRELEIERNDGGRSIALVNAAPLLDANGSLAGGVCSYIDITDSKFEQQRQRMLADAAILLSESLALESRLERVAEIAVQHLADWCIVDLLRDDGRLERTAVAHRSPEKREAVERLRAFPPERPRSSHIFAALETRQPQLIPLINEDVADGNPDLGHLIRELGIHSLMCVPLMARNKCLGVLSFVSASRTYGPRDLDTATELALRAAMALDNALLYHAANEANRMKDEFLATVSHELRTPLTSIVGWVGMLKHDPSSTELRDQSLMELENSANNLRRLVEDLLDVGRIASGKFRLEAQPADLAAIVRGARDAVMPSAIAKSIEVVLTAASETMVFGDPLRLHQIVVNLLNNSIKFTPRHGRIDIRLDSQSDAVTIRISDTGQGIAPQFLPRVFERFSQADRGSASGGLGIGLALVKDLVEMHGGRVYAESEGAGRGATFTVVLPLLTASAS